jgi:hypothetical protein
MGNKISKTKTRVRRSSARPVAGAARAGMSAGDLARLGGGEIAYIKELTSEEAERLFPALPGLPRGIAIFSLCAADGTPIALTDTRKAALEHAIGDELSIVTVH